MQTTQQNHRFRFLDTAIVTGVPQDVTVCTSDGETVGNLAGFLLVPNSTHGEYAVISQDGSNAYRTVPLGRTELDTDAQALTIDVPARMLDALPSSDLEHLSASSDDDYARFREGTLRALGGPRQHDDREPDWWKAVVQARERAQPGAIIGIETRGTRTHLGETKSDERERREEVTESDKPTS